MLLFLCIVFCGCDAFFNSPLSDVEIVNQAAGKTIRLYVYGAVEREGYVEVAAGSTYDVAIHSAGLLPESVLPSYAAVIVNENLTRVAVDYYDGSVARQCVNVNGVLVIGRFHVDGISDNIINMLADYIEQHGKISNKNELVAALGDDYSANFYKFFVAEEDYEEAD